MRLIDADKLIMNLYDWWYSTFKGRENERSIAIRTVIDKVEKYVTDAPTIEPCEDAISRADAINKVCEYGVALERKGEVMMATGVAKQWAIDILEELPTVAPTAKSVVANINLDTDEMAEKVMARLEANHLIRCKECEHRDDDYVCYKWASVDECPHVNPDDFCSYGERKESE